MINHNPFHISSCWKKMLLPVLLLVMMAGSLTSCVDEEEFANTPRGNFEALWKIIDEH